MFFPHPGVHEADWRALALDALQSLRFDIARKVWCFHIGGQGIG
jgi:hypothetical protein